jgi:hypothetical protein
VDVATIQQDRATIKQFRGDLGSIPFSYRQQVSRALDRWTAALDAFEACQQGSKPAPGPSPAPSPNDPDNKLPDVT